MEKRHLSVKRDVKGEFISLRLEKIYIVDFEVDGDEFDFFYITDEGSLLGIDGKQLDGKNAFAVTIIGDV